MPKSNAERQRTYREKHHGTADKAPDELRLSLSLPLGAKLALERLAAHHGITQRETLERLLADAEAATVAGMDGARHQAYLDKDVTR